ncbi:MAG: bifunctional oligoribonuclease/PAP phosphatase NrnA [Candidatus Doudnabacteria bacterium]|nr:bifunctional oligoribonuclease/PAP phosphatase NrnA [Candidatus Doudnabacteria bacterium]
MSLNILEQFNKAKQAMEATSSVLLTMHEHMDGDDGGSVLALKLQLEKMGKRVECAIKKGVPESLQFMPGSHTIKDDIEHENFDLVIACGCGEKKRCGSLNILELNLPFINIDHHHDNKLFGHINMVDAKKSSVAELVYDFFKFCDWEITKDISTCLLTGIITDTGSFRHSNTQSSTLKAAGELLSRGANLSLIIKNTYKNKTPKSFAAWGNALKNTYYDEKTKIIYSIMAEDDIKKLDSSLPQNAFEGFVETLNAVPEAKFAMFLKQDGGVIKGSLRSELQKGIDVSEVARIFGGGGHKLAAGFSVAGKLVKDEVGKWKVI